MKKQIVLSTATLALLIFAATSVGTASAFGGNGGQHNGNGNKSGKATMQMRMNGNHGLFSEELRERMRNEHKDTVDGMTDDEREAYRAELREKRDEHREEMKDAFEDFLGLSKDEVDEYREDGKTMAEILEMQGIDESDAEEFLSERANNHVEHLDTVLDLTDDEEETLLEKIEERNQKILDRWFD